MASLFDSLNHQSSVVMGKTSLSLDDQASAQIALPQ